MKVSGFTVIRNAIKYDYPVSEAITSILPFCDEVIVAVGNSSDGTLDLVKQIESPKIKIIETAIQRHGIEKLAPLKEALGEGYSFGEIRAVIAHLNFKSEFTELRNLQNE